MLNRALAIIHDEHRALSAVLHGLRFLVRDMREKHVAPDFKLLWAMIYYMEAFSERLHNPREDAYLFTALKTRTHEADEIIATLERQHVEGGEHVRQLELALGQLEAGITGALEKFSAAADRLTEEAWDHMSLEEKLVIPLAKKHLTTEDWITIGEAFSENGDPRFGPKPDHEFRDLFTRIVNLAPPPIGVGPARD
ncbi:MAG: hemerythrin domain-containing protein [Rhodocyclaceae bacterium]|nr:hemerythrin domain-containing protein [Rhodocyclaceae bacterium]MDZ4214667.1 hemerythrin domain-containing protein [Rhodocyclaceae bacterium]